MSAEEVLRASESSALQNNQIISHVTGKDIKVKSSKKIKSFGAVSFLTALIIFFVIMFGSGNIIPSAISERLIEETDIQYADAVESKKIVFQQALMSGNIPDNTVRVLKDHGVLVGYVDDREFIESNNEKQPLSLKIGDKIVSAENFIDEVNNNVNLYNAFNLATYSRAAYYYDKSAEEVFKRIGTNRNNYTGNSDFDEVMNSVMGKGNNIDINSVSRVEKKRVDERTGQEEVSYEYAENGSGIKTGSDSTQFINNIRNKISSSSTEEATLDSADVLKVADTISKEQRSSLFFLVFMENISKMKAGEGNDSKINEAMNFLYENSENEVVDVNSGETVKVSGTALDSPSLYSILAGDKVDPKRVENYSSDRILKTVKNKLGVNSENNIRGTVTSTAPKTKGSIGRFISSGVAFAESKILELVSPTVSNSLINNSYDDINGINAGEFLVEGAVNVGKELAKKSGATAGDTEAITRYARLNSDILAMDKASDRLDKSPFDITSKNTFLGSIVFNLAFNLRNSGSSFLSGINSIMSTTSNSISALLPSTYADQTEGFLTTFGDCETYKTIGATGSVHCSEIATFDTTTLNDPFNDPGFIKFIEDNTTLNESGSRTINKDSLLAKFTIYNNERITPLGVTDGGILDSLANDSDSLNPSSNILEMIKTFLGSNKDTQRVATGEAFVNSEANPDWQTYKYAQRYISLARATESLRQYAGDKSAYNNIRFFEGDENPVVAFLDEYYQVAEE